MSLHMLGLSSDKTNLGMLDQKRSTYPYIITMVFLTITYAFLAVGADCTNQKHACHKGADDDIKKQIYRCVKGQD